MGPTAVIEYAIFLLQNRAYYDSTYRTITQFSSSEGKASLRERVHFAESTFHPHYASILDSRDIFIMPMTNAWGYYFKQYVTFLSYSERRTERGIDVNRDFPFDYTSPPYNCFQSESSRAVHGTLLPQHVHGHHHLPWWNATLTYEWGDGYNKQLRAKISRPLCDEICFRVAEPVFQPRLSRRRHQRCCLPGSRRHGRVGATRAVGSIPPTRWRRSRQPAAHIRFG